MKLSKKRDILDELDKKITKLLNERFIIVEKIKKIKEQDDIPITDIKREKQVIATNKQYIDERFHKQFENIYQALIEASKEIQEL